MELEGERERRRRRERAARWSRLEARGYTGRGTVASIAAVATITAVAAVAARSIAAIASSIAVAPVAARILAPSAVGAVDNEPGNTFIGAGPATRDGHRTEASNPIIADTERDAASVTAAWCIGAIVVEAVRDAASDTVARWRCAVEPDSVATTDASAGWTVAIVVSVIVSVGVGVLGLCALVLLRVVVGPVTIIRADDRETDALGPRHAEGQLVAPTGTGRRSRPRSLRTDGANHAHDTALADTAIAGSRTR